MEQEPLTDEQLDEWEKVCQAATPGPWEWENWGDERDTARYLQSPPETRPGGRSELFPDLHNDVLYCEEEPEEGDKVFIATARAAMPLLIAEVRRLRMEAIGLRSKIAVLERKG